MKRILVVSLAEAAEPALIGPTVQLAQETGAAVTVLAVDDVESQRFETLPRGESLGQAEATAQRLADRLAESGVAATAIGRSGPAADTAIELADQLDADLIVVASSHRRPMVERMLGSLAFDLVRRAGRQVLVVSDGS